MPSRRSVEPQKCKVLFENIIPEQEQEPDIFGLPDSFPAHALDDDQLEEVREWWGGYMPDLLHAFKHSLVCQAKRYASTECPPTLQNFIIRAVVLAHLLRLHPATEDSLLKLAKALKVPHKRLYYAREAILETLTSGAVSAFKAAREGREAVIEFLATHPALDYSGAVRVSSRRLLIPLAGRLSPAARHALMKDCAAVPGVASVGEDSLDDNRRALRVNLKA